MASRKIHHFVPQFYLRNFASSEDGKHIGLYNYQRNILVPFAAIKHQACEKFLYGDDDEIEAALSKLEHYTAYIFQRLLQYFMPPPENSFFFSILLEFVLYQLSRTVKAGKETNEMLSSGFKEVFKKTALYKEKYENIEFLHEQPTLFSLVFTGQALPLMKYLSCKLLINRSNMPFITSDQPAFKYNSFLEQKKRKQGTTGLASKGLQIFLPIHPQVMLIFYDPAVYKLGNRKDKTIETFNFSDIDQLNGLQYIHSDSQLFFSYGVDKNYFAKLTSKYQKIKMASGPISTSYNKKGDDEKRNFLIVNTNNEPQIALNLSFMTLTKHAKQFELDNKVVFPRHPSFLEFRNKNRTLEF